MTDRAIVVDELDVPLTTWSDETRGEVRFRTLIGDGRTATDSLTAGVTEMEPGDWLGHHRHEPAEIYYILQGEGTVALGGEEAVVAAGSAVFIPGGLEHGIRNTGKGPLRFFYTFAVDSMGDVEYHFSADE
jgi:mannose-6-phosphate isomerase-like protein (cupin superfamily)